MKTGLPRFILACTAFAAALSACGGNDPITDNPQLSKQPVLESLGATRTAGLMAAFAAQRPAADEPGDAPPGTTAPPSTMPSEDGLGLVIENGEAKVCQPKGRILVCAVVEAPLPAGTLVHYWHLPDGTSALTYLRAPGVAGVPDPNGVAAVRFQAAFNGAARAVLAYPGANVRTRGREARGMVCENEDCVEDRDSGGQVIEVTGHGGGGGGGGGGGFDGSGGGGGGGGAGDGSGSDMPVVTVRGIPDPVAATPVIRVTGQYNPNTPLLPPRDPMYDLAQLDNGCVTSPIATVCVRGRRPPLPPSERLPSGKMPWLPQTLCDWAHIFCSEGQEPRDNDRGSDASTSGKTKTELDQICINQNIVDIDVCYANIRPSSTGNWREFEVCKQHANNRMFACFETANRVTNYGEHPAP